MDFGAYSEFNEKQFHFYSVLFFFFPSHKVRLWSIFLFISFQQIITEHLASITQNSASGSSI